MKQKILFGISLLFGLLFINSGLNKFLNYMPMPENMPEATMKNMELLLALGWLMPLVAVVEIIGGLLIIFPKTRALGALVIFPIMVGILVTHAATDISTMPLALIFGLILAWIMFENKEKYLQLIK